jgi:hypothetical protein
MPQTPTLGRIVRYVPEDGDELPAIVVSVDGPATRTPTGTEADFRPPVDPALNLVVFQNSDVRVEWRQSVPYSAEPTPGTWHWPPR